MVNFKLLEDKFGFSEREIEILPRVSSWGITQGETSLDKKEVGLMVKRIIDFSRI
jgi:hypothetical protein